MRAMWKKLNGSSKFTGIVMPNIHDEFEMKYLHDDPLTADIDITNGHQISQREFMTSMIFYDDPTPSTIEFKSKIKYNVQFLSMDLVPEMMKEMKKMRYGAKLEAYNGVWYPYQSCATTSVQSIRTLDSIKVTAISNNGVEGMHETFWVLVVAVTPRGDIVGYSQNDLYHYPIAAGNYIVCQIKNVMFASKGPHWKDVPYGTIIGDPCDNPTCHEWEMGEEKFKRCSRCQQVIYCRPECQRAHWLSGHRQVCKKSETNSRGTHDDDGNNNNPNAPMSGGGSIANQKCSCCNTKFSDDVCSSNIVAEREAVASAAAVQASLVEQLQQGWLMSEKEATAWIAQERQQKQQKAAAAAAEATAAAEKAAHEAAVLLAQEQPEQEAAAAAVQRQQQLEFEAAEAVAAERAAHTAAVFAKEQQDKQEATAAAADGE